MAAWHSSWLDVFGVAWKRDDFAWLARERPPFIYVGGITLSPQTNGEQIRSAPASVYDSWGALDLEPYGFRFWRTETWFLRAPVPPEFGADPSELQIVEAGPAEVQEFEAVSGRGFGGEEAEALAVGSIHPPNRDPRLRLWLGRVDGSAVSAATSYRTDRAVGIFGVTTIEPARGRGYATALMRRAMLPESGLPAVLNTDSDVAARLYRRLGFEQIGECVQWLPGPVSRTDPDGILT